MLTSLRGNWLDLDGDWTMCLALSRTADDFYNFASPEQRTKVREMEIRYNDVENTYRREEIIWEFMPHVRRVVTFLDYCSCLILQGRLRVRDVYSVLGSDVARHGWAVRRLVGADRSPDPNSPVYMSHAGTPDYMGYLADDSSHARQQRLLTLIDRLWAQAAKDGDRQAHNLLATAEHKRVFKSGRLNRIRVRRQSRDWSGPLLGLRLQWLLLYGEFLPTRSVLQDGKEIFGYVDWRVVRVGIWPARAIHRFLGGYVDLSHLVRIRKLRTGYLCRGIYLRLPERLRETRIAKGFLRLGERWSELGY